MVKEREREREKGGEHVNVTNAMDGHGASYMLLPVLIGESECDLVE